MVVGVADQRGRRNAVDEYAGPPKPELLDLRTIPSIIVVHFKKIPGWNQRACPPTGSPQMWERYARFPMFCSHDFEAFFQCSLLMIIIIIKFVFIVII